MPRTQPRTGSATERPAVGQSVALVDVDAGLAEVVGEGDLQLARRVARATEIDVAAGAALPSLAPALGWIVVAGIVNREVTVADRPTPELLGAGGLVQAPVVHNSSVPCRIETRAVTDAVLVELDGRFPRYCGRWPAWIAVLADRLAQQHQRLGVQAALSMQPRITDRLLGSMWHLAAEFGRVSPRGTLLDLPLSHAQLARFTGSRRPTVTLALKELALEGLTAREPDGTWLLLGHPADALRRLDTNVEPPPIIGRAWRAQAEARAVRSESRALRAEAEQARRHSSD